MPYWGIEGSNKLVLYGTLRDVLLNNPTRSGVHIHIPRNVDVKMPINNNYIEFRITNADGNLDDCRAFVSNQGSVCRVDSAKIGRYLPTHRITVTGLGRIDGWDALRDQNVNGYEFPDYRLLIPGININAVGADGYSAKENAEWYINALLLSLSSEHWVSYPDYSIGVSGIEVAWGSSLGPNLSPVQLNSRFALNRLSWEPDDGRTRPPVRLYDFKLVGNWIGGSDGPDIMGKSSVSTFTYTHVNDNNIKVAAGDTVRKHSTVLQGNAGCAINLGAYGMGDINNSTVDGVYVHRSLYYRSDTSNGCGGNGGLICTQSCGRNTRGLVNATVSNVDVADLSSTGTNRVDANSIAVPFGIGLDWRIEVCDAAPIATVYPIRDLIFKNVTINPRSGCDSRVYDNRGSVKWGTVDNSGNVLANSAIFYDETRSDPTTCSFNGTVQYQKPDRFVCGVAESADAKYCMSSIGVLGSSGTPNIVYNIIDGENANVEFPFCVESPTLVCVLRYR